MSVLKATAGILLIIKACSIVVDTGIRRLRLNKEHGTGRRAVCG